MSTGKTIPQIREIEIMTVTIKDIATDAKVSVSTVSRVLNGSKKVSGDLQRQVMRSIEKYGYKPNVAARSLITKKTGLVAVVVADLTNPITAIHLKQISEVCMEHDKIMICCGYDMDNDKAVAVLDKMLERVVDGLIFMGIQLREDILEKLGQFTCPVVLGNQGLPPGIKGYEFRTVTVDSYHTAMDVTKFLIEEGHERIAYIGGGREDYTNGTLRLKGFQDVMGERGLDVPDSYVIQGEFSTESGYQGMKKIYENSRFLPTAVICGSDIIAIGVIRFLKYVKLKVPDDISVFGFDDSVEDIYDPPLSTVRMYRQGELLYQALFDEEGERNSRTYFPYKLLRRNSTRKLNGN